MAAYATCSECGEGIDINTPYVHGEPGGGMKVGPSKKLHHVPGTHPGCDGHPTCLFCKADRRGAGGTAAVHAARIEESGGMPSPFQKIDEKNPIHAAIMEQVQQQRNESLASGADVNQATVKDRALNEAFAAGAAFASTQQAGGGEKIHLEVRYEGTAIYSRVFESHEIPSVLRIVSENLGNGPHTEIVLRVMAVTSPVRAPETVPDDEIVDAEIVDEQPKLNP